MAKKTVPSAAEALRLSRLMVVTGVSEENSMFFPPVMDSSCEKRIMGSEKTRAVGHFFIDTTQHHKILLVGKTRDQHFRDESGNLTRCKIDHAYYLLSHQGFGGIMFRDLGAGFFYAQLAQVYP